MAAPLPPPSPEVLAMLRDISPATWNALRTAITHSPEGSRVWATIGKPALDALRSIPPDAIPYVLEYIATKLPGGVEQGARRAIYSGLVRASAAAQRAVSRSGGGFSQTANWLTAIGVSTTGAATALSAWAENLTANTVVFPALKAFAERGALGSAAWYLQAGARWTVARVAQALGTGGASSGGASAGGGFVAAEFLIGVAAVVVIAGIAYGVYSAMNAPPQRSASTEAINRGRFGQPTVRTPPPSSPPRTPERSTRNAGPFGCVVPVLATLADGRGASCHCVCANRADCFDNARALARCRCDCTPFPTR